VRTFVDGQPVGNLTRDEVLDNITLYWLTNTGVSASRLYWEYKGGFFNTKGVSVPVAVTVFPGEQYQAPRSWAERAYPNLIYYSQVDRGGHFAAWSSPSCSLRSSAPRSAHCASSNGPWPATRPAPGRSSRTEAGIAVGWAVTDQSCWPVADANASRSEPQAVCGPRRPTSSWTPPPRTTNESTPQNTSLGFHEGRGWIAGCGSGRCRST
jgi:hypothetical protein